MKLDYLVIPHTRINSKSIKDLNVRPESINIVEENIGRKILDIAFNNILSYISPQEWKTKEKINKWNYIKLKGVCIAMETINKIKRQPMEWENTFTNISDKGLISKIYKELTKLNTKKPNNPIKKWSKDLDTYPKRTYRQPVDI